ncbi:siderophore-interacting protein [Nesterenkonia populi]|uniref:siderophore-interacting protein n=1 Tax=Nesterenkonia populi TaxID=1591087 RepID=UPI0011BE7AC4|nr:siderophore-interacting protein [Nesterenkonia populi]
MSDKPRKPRRQTLLYVVRREQLTPHMVRLVLGGEGFRDIEFKEDTDQYIKVLFTDPSLGLEPPYDMDALREQLPPEQMPATRTYTIRHIDREAEQIWVDFVVHGDDGLAGPWAAHAEPGEKVCFFGPGSGYSPRPEADWHLLAGDAAALPAIASSLEAMGPDSEGLALIEVHGEAEQQPIAAPAGVEVRWLHRGGDFAPETTLLAAAIEEVELPQGDVQVFVHGERAQMKTIRRHLVKERGLSRRGLSISAYWAHGRKEQEFQAEKRTPAGQIEED